MSTTGVSLSLFVGENKHILGTALNSVGTPFDLSGATMKWVVQQSLADTTPPILYKDTANGIVITDPLKGLFTINISATDFSAVIPSTYNHIAKLIDNTGESSIAFSGLLTLQQGSKNL